MATPLAFAFTVMMALAIFFITIMGQTAASSFSGPGAGAFVWSCSATSAVPCSEEHVVCGDGVVGCASAANSYPSLVCFDTAASVAVSSWHCSATPAPVPAEMDCVAASCEFRCAPSNSNTPSDYADCSLPSTWGCNDEPGCGFNCPSGSRFSKCFDSSTNAFVEDSALCGSGSPEVSGPVLAWGSCLAISAESHSVSVDANAITIAWELPADTAAQSARAVLSLPPSAMARLHPTAPARCTMDDVDTECVVLSGAGIAVEIDDATAVSSVVIILNAAAAINSTTVTTALALPSGTAVFTDSTSITMGSFSSLTDSPAVNYRYVAKAPAQGSFDVVLPSAALGSLFPSDIANKTVASFAITATTPIDVTSASSCFLVVDGVFPLSDGAFLPADAVAVAGADTIVASFSSPITVADASTAALVCGGVSIAAPAISGTVSSSVTVAVTTSSLETFVYPSVTVETDTNDAANSVFKSLLVAKTSKSLDLAAELQTTSTMTSASESTPTGHVVGLVADEFVPLLHLVTENNLEEALSSLSVTVSDLEITSLCHEMLFSSTSKATFAFNAEGACGTVEVRCVSPVTGDEVDILYCNKAEPSTPPTLPDCAPALGDVVVAYGAGSIAITGRISQPHVAESFTVDVTVSRSDVLDISALDECEESSAAFTPCRVSETTLRFPLSVSAADSDNFHLTATVSAKPAVDVPVTVAASYGNKDVGTVSAVLSTKNVIVAASHAALVADVITTKLNAESTEGFFRASLQCNGGSTCPQQTESINSLSIKFPAGTTVSQTPSVVAYVNNDDSSPFWAVSSKRTPSPTVIEASVDGSYLRVAFGENAIRGGDKIDIYILGVTVVRGNGDMFSAALVAANSAFVVSSGKFQFTKPSSVHISAHKAGVMRLTYPVTTGMFSYSKLLALTGTEPAEFRVLPDGATRQIHILASLPLERSFARRVLTRSSAEAFFAREESANAVGGFDVSNGASQFMTPDQGRWTCADGNDDCTGFTDRCSGPSPSEMTCVGGANPYFSCAFASYPGSFSDCTPAVTSLNVTRVQTDDFFGFKLDIADLPPGLNQAYDISVPIPSRVRVAEPVRCSTAPNNVDAAAVLCSLADGVLSLRVHPWVIGDGSFYVKTAYVAYSSSAVSLIPVVTPAQGGANIYSGESFELPASQNSALSVDDFHAEMYATGSSGGVLFARFGNFNGVRMPTAGNGEPEFANVDLRIPSLSFNDVERCIVSRANAGSSGAWSLSKAAAARTYPDTPSVAPLIKGSSGSLVLKAGTNAVTSSIIVMCVFKKLPSNAGPYPFDLYLRESSYGNRAKVSHKGKNLNYVYQFNQPSPRVVRLVLSSAKVPSAQVQDGLKAAISEFLDSSVVSTLASYSAPRLTIDITLSTAVAPLALHAAGVAAGANSGSVSTNNAIPLANEYARLLADSHGEAVEDVEIEAYSLLPPAATWLCVDGSSHSVCTIPNNCGTSFQGDVKCVAANGDVLPDSDCSSNVAKPSPKSRSDGCDAKIILAFKYNSPTVPTLDVSPDLSSPRMGSILFSIKLSFSNELLDVASTIDCGSDATCSVEGTDVTILVEVGSSTVSVPLNGVSAKDGKYATDIIVPVSATDPARPGSNAYPARSSIALPNVGYSIIVSAARYARALVGGSGDKKSASFVSAIVSRRANQNWIRAFKPTAVIILLPSAWPSLVSCSFAWREANLDGIQSLHHLSGSDPVPVDTSHTGTGNRFPLSEIEPETINALRFTCEVGGAIPNNRGTMRLFFETDDKHYTLEEPFSINGALDTVSDPSLPVSNIIRIAVPSGSSRSIDLETFTDAAVTAVTGVKTFVVQSSAVEADGAVTSVLIATKLTGEQRTLADVYTDPTLCTFLVRDLRQLLGFEPSVAQEAVSYTGSWLCKTGNNPFAACQADNGCGPVAGTQKCIVGSSTESSDAHCASTPKITEDRSRCGAYQCRRPDGVFVDCDAYGICTEGCSDSVVSLDVTPGVNSGTLAQHCVRGGQIVDAGRFCPQGFVPFSSYASTCSPVSACAMACTGAGGKRTDCNSPESWSECSNTCGSGSQQTTQVCTVASATVGQVPTAVPAHLCEFAADKPAQTRQCTSESGCVGHHWRCSPSSQTKDNVMPCDVNASWQTCSPRCSKTRFVGCAIYVGGTFTSYGTADKCSGSAPDASASCSDGLCAAPEWKCGLSNGTGAFVPCGDDIGFDPCPQSGCAFPSSNRLVKCMRGDYETEDSDCLRNGIDKPTSVRSCPLVKDRCKVSFERTRCIYDSKGDVISGMDGICIPTSTPDLEVFMKGTCINTAGQTVPLSWCDASTVKKCDIPACSPDPIWKCHPVGGNANAPISCANNGAFEPCPSQGCSQAVVKRQVGCYVGNELVSTSSCIKDGPAPLTRFDCPVVTSHCRASFASSTCAFDADGVYDPALQVTCVPEDKPDFKVFTKAKCVDAAGADVNESWCSDVDMLKECTLPSCSEGQKLNWRVEAGNCISPESRCATYRVRKVSCFAESPHVAAQEVDSRLCNQLTRPPTAESCPTTGLVVCDRGFCSTSSAVVDGVTFATIQQGVCRCEPGFAGVACDIAFKIETVSVDFAGPDVLIDWTFNMPVDASNNGISGGLTVAIKDGDAPVPRTFAIVDVTNATSVRIPVLDVAEAFGAGSLTATVTVGGISNGASFTLPPLCKLAAFDCVGGSCNEETGKCECKGDYSGSRCDVSPCETIKCNTENGHCDEEIDDVAFCSCPFDDGDGTPLFADPLCHTPVGCKDIPCENGGFPTGRLSGENSTSCGVCSCQGNWEGDSCGSCGLESVCVFGNPNQACTACDCGIGYRGENCGCRYVGMTMAFKLTSMAWYLGGGTPVATWARGLELATSYILGTFANGFAVHLDSHELIDGRDGKAGYVRATLHVTAPCIDNNDERFNTLNVDEHMKPLYDALDRFKVAFASRNIENDHSEFRGVISEAGLGLEDPNCLGFGCPYNLGSGGKVIDPTPVNPDDKKTHGSQGMSNGAKIGIGIACGTAGFAALVFLLLSMHFRWCCFSDPPPPTPSGSGATRSTIQMSTMDF